MQWKPPEWDTHSILQIRVNPKGAATQQTSKVAQRKVGDTETAASNLTFHQERLPNETARLAMRDRRRACSKAIERYVGSLP